MNDNILLYGAEWCGDCKRSRAFLDTHHINYTYINIDDDPLAADKVVEINKGLRSIPTIVFPDGRVLVEPSDEDLAKALHMQS